MFFCNGVIVCLHCTQRLHAQNCTYTPTHRHALLLVFLQLPHKTKSQVDNHRDGVSTLESQVADKDHQLKTLQANNKASSAGGRPVPAVWQQELSIEQLMKEKATLENLVDNLRHKISTLETQVADKDHQLKTLRMGAYNKASSAGGRLIPAVWQQGLC